MKERESYSGIDNFRVFAALLIIAIHTSPLASVNETADFILTRILARVAVPFFFMTSGFFLISRYACKTEKLWRFLKRTALIYGIAILLYVPLNLYNGYFKTEPFLPNLFKDLVFDGTMYHLWYLPASMLGGAIAWGLVRGGSYKKAFFIAGVLYLIGLLGDSYYGVAERIPVLGTFFNLLFQVMDYTRNGLFFAPIFFVLGGYLADQGKALPDVVHLSKERSIKESNIKENSIKESGVKENHIKENVIKESSIKESSIKESSVKESDIKENIIKENIIKKRNITKISIGFLISLLLLLGEGLTLHHFGLQRHDSMYVFLLPCMYFLFCFLLHFRGKRREKLRTLSLAVYILHPFMIVIVRFLARPMKLWGLLVENSLVHYLTVCLLSVGMGILFTMLWEKWRQKKEKHDTARDRAYIELDLKNLEHNVKTLQGAMPSGCELMAVVKAESYGHGMYEITTTLDRMGVKAFAVATIDEGIRLRKYGIRGEVLILGYTAPKRAVELCRYHLTQTLLDYQYAIRLNQEGYPVKAHIKIDTGMHRLGFAPEKLQEIKETFSMKHLKITGIFTHLACADSLEEEDECFTRKQIATFYQLLERLKKKGLQLPKVHIQSSYGLLNYPSLSCDYVRTGIAMYGVLSSPGDWTKLSLDLRPVLSLKARVVLLRKIQKGESVGYSRAFVADKDSLIAILPVGYADGFPRNLSCEKADVLICGRKAPIIGKICMDQMAVDVTEVPGVEIGSIATLIGRDGKEEITAPMTAESAESITNELLSRMGSRLTVVPRT